METLFLGIIFIVILGFCYTLWKSAVKEEKKELNNLFR